MNHNVLGLWLEEGAPGEFAYEDSGRFDTYFTSLEKVEC